MGIQQVIQNYVASVSALWLGGMKRLQNAQSLIQANTYTANQFAQDAMGTWIDTWNVWWSLIPSTASPVLPTIMLTVTPATPNPTNSVYLAAALPAGTPLDWTDLYQVGGANSIKHADMAVALSPAGDQITATYNPVGAAAVAGFYQGLVVVKGTVPDAPLALILLRK